MGPLKRRDQREARADRVAALEMPAHERLVDETHGQAVQRVAVVEAAPAHDRQIERR